MLKFTAGDLQKVQDEIKTALKKQFTNKSALIGIHEDEAARDDNADINNATLGASLHFGSGGIPARPWLDAGVETGADEYSSILQENFDNQEQALEQIGVVAVSKVQIYMDNLRTPPISATTIALKGSSNPLIDTGNLKQSVTYSITDEKPSEGIG